MRFSIVVPTYNEEKDISLTLESLVSLDWIDYEIIVVDDSTDNTPEIVRAFSSRGVRLIRPEKREGRCGARNTGIMESSGEIVVILNADVRLPSNFLILLSSHYEQGADYVLVRSMIENMEDLFARYVECVGLVRHYNGNPDCIEWTEGFSCRRQLAIDAGLFPTGFAVPICAGEDGFFGENLRRLGARKKVDLNIVCTHVAPALFSEYWYIRKGRGQGSPQIRRFVQKWSFSRIGFRALLRVFRTLVMVGGFFPMILTCHQIARKSPRGRADIIPFCWAWFIEQVAFHVGEWQSLRQIFIKERNLKILNV